MRQNLNFQNKALQDRKFGPKMGDEIFYGQKSFTFRDIATFTNDRIDTFCFLADNLIVSNRKRTLSHMHKCMYQQLSTVLSFGLEIKVITPP